MIAIIMKDLDVVVVVFCILLLLFYQNFFCDGDSEMVVSSNADLSLFILPYLFLLFRAFTTVSCTVFDISRRSIRDREIKLRLFLRKS